MLEREVHVWKGELPRTESPSALPGVSRRALREVLSRYLDEDPAAIDFRAGEHGKPALADPAATLHFNLSHSGSLILIAVCDGREIGVDVERIRPRRYLLGPAERRFTPASAAAVRNASPEERVAVFHEEWVRHEATVKCHGTGLWAKPPPSPSPLAVAAFGAGEGYAAAIAVAAESMPPVRPFELVIEPQLRATSQDVRALS